MLLWNDALPAFSQRPKPDFYTLCSQRRSPGGIHFSSLLDEEFDFEFWKRSENGKVEIDGYIPLASVGIGIEVKYQSGLSGMNQLEKEARS